MARSPFAGPGHLRLHCDDFSGTEWRVPRFVADLSVRAAR
ncbi:hypothetical protein AB395_0000857 [Sinorhizobium fredii CCBAU 45436]|nr:hypothetical protein AB395_0000857 [Sinorhizobium fredii CCBAU 45436]